MKVRKNRIGHQVNRSYMSRDMPHSSLLFNWSIGQMIGQCKIIMFTKCLFVYIFFSLFFFFLCFSYQLFYVVNILKFEFIPEILLKMLNQMKQLNIVKQLLKKNSLISVYTVCSAGDTLGNSTCTMSHGPCYSVPIHILWQLSQLVL